MTDKSLARVGGVCSILLGLLYLAGGIAYFTVPHDAAQFPQTFTHLSVGPHLMYWFYGVGALFALCAVAAITNLCRQASTGFARWMENLGYLGFAVVAVECFRAIGVNYWIATAYSSAGTTAQSALAGMSTMALDPIGWLTLGCVGLWLIATSIMAGSNHAFSGSQSTLGAIVGLLYWLALLGVLINASVLIHISAFAGSIVCGPIFYIWTGFTLEHAGSVSMPEATPLSRAA